MPIAQSAGGNNRTNSSNLPRSILGRTSQTIQQVIPANSSLPLSVSGSNFYLLAASGVVSIKPSGGAFNPYTPGTGATVGLENAFDLLEIKNENAYPVAFALFVGFDGYLDNRVIFADTGVKLVGYPTYSVQSTAATVNIIDLSGQPFVDINGGKWYAINRVSMTVFNPDTVSNILVQKFGATGPTDPAIAFVQPNTSWRESLAGDYTIRSGANINAIVNEVYNAIPRL